MRHLAALAVAVLTAAVAAGQRPEAKQALPIPRDTLDRLNLRADWSVYIPIVAKRDGLAHIQPVDEHQVYISTKAGLLVAVDARTGRQQWSFKFPVQYVGTFPVAVNDKYCFAVSVGKLFCFDRYTGSLMLEQDLREAFPHREETPVSGPVADNRNVFIQMASGWLVNYLLPIQLQPVPDKPKQDPKAKAYSEKNPIDQVVRDYATRVNPPMAAPDEFDRRLNTTDRPDRIAGQNRDQATPSISALYSVVPPYQLNRDTQVASIAILPTVIRPPYKLVPDHYKYNQQSPSINSQSAIYRLDEDSSLRAVGDKFKREWRYVLPQRSIARPIMVDNSNDPYSSRMWISTEGEPVLALNKAKGTEEVVGKFVSKPLHPLVGPYAFTTESLLGFIPLDNGVVLGIDLTAGVRAPDRAAVPVVYAWKSAVGGQMNHRPIAGSDAIYVSGDRSGCAKLDAKTGDVLWRTESEVDEVLAVNGEYVYAHDTRGRLVVYAKDGRPDPRSKFVRPAVSLDIPEFTVTTANDKTDRILLGGDNGLVISLRDMAAKYAKPVRIAPPAKQAARKVEPKPADPMAPMPGEPMPPKN